MRLRPCSADLHALVPRVTKVRGTCASTVVEPRTAATATARFARFLDDAAFQACGGGGRRSGGWCCICGNWSKTQEDENAETANTHWSSLRDQCLCTCCKPQKHLRLQAPMPSNHLWPTFSLPTPPHFLNQAPPGAQQLSLPDFLNVPHREQTILFAMVEAMIVIGVRANRSRSK